MCVNLKRGKAVEPNINTDGSVFWAELERLKIKVRTPPRTTLNEARVDLASLGLLSFSPGHAPTVPPQWGDE